MTRKEWIDVVSASSIEKLAEMLMFMQRQIDECDDVTQLADLRDGRNVISAVGQFLFREWESYLSELMESRQ